jgi:hypothetical protein
MKRVIVCLVAIFVVFSFVGLASVYAYPALEVEGFVDPTTATLTYDSVNKTTTFSQVFYHFDVMTADFGGLLDRISVEFENDVFAGLGSIVGTNPTDWSYDTVGSYVRGNTIGVFPAETTGGGTLLGLGDTLRFTVSDLVVYDAAVVPGNNLWQEGQIWAQSWTVHDTLGGGDGGSTALVPEPGTLMLFGAGIAGLFYVRRTKLFNI